MIPSMKVLFQNRSDALTSWGGDTTQMMQTREELHKLGVDGEVSVEAEPDLAGYDLVHIFNIQTAKHGIRQIENAKQQGVPVVLSPIYWSNRHFYSDPDLIKYHSLLGVRLLARWWWRLPAWGLALNRRFGTKAERLHRMMLEQADILLPNSQAETDILIKEFSAPWIKEKSVVVPNGISARSGKGAVPIPDCLSGLGQYVLQVARFETVKGQLKVIKALYDDREIPIVFVGASGNELYCDACRRLAEQRGNVYFLSAIAHEKIEGVYRGAKVHVLPSLRESPGLVTLEAALAGVNCVVSIHGPVEEYFGDYVWLCDPLDIQSIRTAVISAWNAQGSMALHDRLLRLFTWEKAAKATLFGYERALSVRKR